MPSARTACPDCHSENILDLRTFLRSPGYDYFRCNTCNCWWMVPRDADAPATRVILGNPKLAANVPGSPPRRVCPKCGSQANMLDDMSLFARVDYYRCARCQHLFAHEAGDPNSPSVDISIQDDNKAS